MRKLLSFLDKKKPEAAPQQSDSASVPEQVDAYEYVAEKTRAGLELIRQGQYLEAVVLLTQRDKHSPQNIRLVPNDKFVDVRREPGVVADDIQMRIASLTMNDITSHDNEIRITRLNFIDRETSIDTPNYYAVMLNKYAHLLTTDQWQDLALGYLEEWLHVQINISGEPISATIPAYLEALKATQVDKHGDTDELDIAFYLQEQGVDIQDTMWVKRYGRESALAFWQEYSTNS